MYRTSIENMYVHHMYVHAGRCVAATYIHNYQINLMLERGALVTFTTFFAVVKKIL